MKVLEVRNVHDALLRGLDLLYHEDRKTESRNGAVYESSTPVTTIYKRPKERVIFWKDRDANPFFHLMESLWMLDGRNDLKFVHQYNKGMENYSDDGVTLHGAYGWRWCSYFTYNQLEVIIDRLKKDPYDRRCVLQMWDPVEDLGRDGKDVPCNTCIYFKIDYEGRLQMTVSNRSNDIIWGAYGANAVHMSILQEYMAACIGVPVGDYYQVSDNFHAYEEKFNELTETFTEKDSFDIESQLRLMKLNPYTSGEVQSYPMVNVGQHLWKLELILFLDRQPFEKIEFTEPFFSEVAVPIQDSWWLHKQGKTDEAMIEIQKCAASDWRKACWEWFSRRIEQ